MYEGTIEFPILESTALAQNRLNDPATREVMVYLPPGYADHSRRYPVVVVLPGYTATHRSLTNYRVFEPDFIERYERLRRENKVGDAIFVAPDCMTRFGGSQYLDSTTNGRYQTFIVEEVLPFVDAKYRTVPERAGRGVVGTSSGGFGALRLGIDRPEAFCAYGSHAGDCAFEVSIRPTFTSVSIVLSMGGGVDSFIRAFEKRGLRGGEFETVMTIASACAYSPAPDVDFPHAELPFDISTALPRPDVWGRWVDHDPLVRIKRKSDTFCDAAFVYIDAGNRDEHGLQFGARGLAAELKGRPSELIYEEFEGGHRGLSHRYEHSLGPLVSALSPK